MSKRSARVDISGMTDQQIANLAGTMVYIFLGRDALELLARDCWAWVERERKLQKALR